MIMASLEESYQKRKKALRKFNDYFNSLNDGHGEEICSEKSNIRQLIEQIRYLNRNLADDDNLYEDELVEQFNSRAHRLAKFLNGSTSNIVYDESQETKRQQIESKILSQNDNVVENVQQHPLQHLFHVQLTETNWLEFYPQMMEFIVLDKKIPNEPTRIKYLKQSIEKNKKATQLLENEYSMKNAVAILREEFSYHSNPETREMALKEMIKKFKFDTNRNNDEKNYRQLFIIALHIAYNIHREYRQKYLYMLLDKLPKNFHRNSINDFKIMVKEKLQYYDALPSFKFGKNEELEQLYRRLIDHDQPCPICYKLKKHIRSHPIIQCRNLREFCYKYGEYAGNTSTSMADLSISSDQTLNQNGFRYKKVNDEKKTSIFTNSNLSSIGFTNDNNNRRRFGFSGDKSLKDKSNSIPGLSPKSSSVSLSNNDRSAESDSEKQDSFPITIIGSKRETLYQINAMIIDQQNATDYDALIRIDYLKSLKIDGQIHHYEVDWRKRDYIVGHVEIEIAIGFLIRTIKFLVFSPEKEEPAILISADILKQFSIMSPSKFEQRFTQIIDRSIERFTNGGDDKRQISIAENLDLKIDSLYNDNDHQAEETSDAIDNDLLLYNDDDKNKPKNVTIQKLMAANFLLKSLPNITNNSSKSFKILLVKNDYTSDDDNYLVNQDYNIYYGWNSANEDRSLDQLKYKKAHIFLFKGEKDSKIDNDYMDSMLIKFDEKKFLILIQLLSNSSDEQYEQIHRMIEKCRNLLA